MNIRALSALVVGALGAVSYSVPHAEASNATAGATVGATGPVTAEYEGRTINLAASWGGAHACLIWRSHGDAECFRTEAELSARELQLRPAPTDSPVGATTASTTSTCSSSLDLYSGSGYTGSHLALWDEGYWQELSYYGFDNITKSFIGGACSFHLAQGDWGQGYWYPGYTGPWAATTDMGSWDNIVSSVYIN